MYRIDINSANNNLEMHLSEFFDAAQGIDLVEDLSKRIHELKPGFKILTDLSQLTDMTLDAYKSIDEVMDLCNQHKVSKVVQVITKDTRDIGFNIMALFHYSHSVVIHTCDSLEEAKRELNIL